MEQKNGLRSGLQELFVRQSSCMSPLSLSDSFLITNVVLYYICNLGMSTFFLPENDANDRTAVRQIKKDDLWKMQKSSFWFQSKPRNCFLSVSVPERKAPIRSKSSVNECLSARYPLNGTSRSEGRRFPRISWRPKTFPCTRRAIRPRCASSFF